jgi:hypothetical protein
MRLVSSRIPIIVREIVDTLRERELIEVLPANLPEVELDVESVLKEYVRTDRALTDEAKDLAAQRGLDYTQHQKIKQQLAEKRRFGLRDEAIPYLANQLIETLLHTGHVEEIFAEDHELRAAIAPVLRRHMARTIPSTKRSASGSRTFRKGRRTGRSASSRSRSAFAGCAGKSEQPGAARAPPRPPPPPRARRTFSSARSRGTRMPLVDDHLDGERPCRDRGPRPRAVGRPASSGVRAWTHSCKLGLVVACRGRRVPGERRGPRCPSRTTAAPVEPQVEVDRADHGLVGIGEQRVLFAAPRAGLPSTRAGSSPEPAPRASSAMLRALTMLARRRLRRPSDVGGSASIKRLGDEQPDDGIAQELEAFVVFVRAGLVGVTLVGQRQGKPPTWPLG